MNVADLHIHSSFSDGEFDWNGLSKLLLNNGISIASITDHDSIEIYKFTSPNDFIRLIPGVELTSKYRDREIHILGYGIDVENSILNQYLSEVENEKKIKTIKFMRSIKRMHLPIEFENEVLRKRIRRKHIKGMVRRMCLDESIYYEIDEIISSLECSSVILTSNACVKLIKDSDGFAFIAHPQLYCASEFELEKMLKIIKVDGIECVTPHHSQEFTEICRRLAKKYSLQISGGSDYHAGKYVIPNEFGYHSLPFIK